MRLDRVDGRFWCLDASLLLKMGAAVPAYRTFRTTALVAEAEARSELGPADEVGPASVLGPFAVAGPISVVGPTAELGPNAEL